MLLSPLCLYKVGPFRNHGSSSSAAARPLLRPPGHRSVSVRQLLCHLLSAAQSDTMAVPALSRGPAFEPSPPDESVRLHGTERQSFLKGLKPKRSQAPGRCSGAAHTCGHGAWLLLPPGSTSGPNVGPGRPRFTSLSSKEVINSDCVRVCVTNASNLK